MVMPLLGALRDLAAARAASAKVQVSATLVTILFGCAAAALVCSAGLVALTDAMGFPIAALVFAAMFAGLALGVMLAARGFVSRTKAEAAKVQNQVKHDIALATSLYRTARPLLPLAAFLAAFALARRP